ncbi:hypothetical protein Zm00014a_015248 [Zea mays]|uniref:Uncharacterized protein n=1 Tax=Zea mays TaxID=4577 RepID=A0A3L6DAQ0_MAIZE|nr:hypothetical protein Zm00014a_015248 [Zea mays]
MCVLLQGGCECGFGANKHGSNTHLHSY